MQKIKLSTIAEALGVSTATVSLALRDSPLVAEDTDGTGHRWELLGDDPWRRLYVGLADDAESGFRAQ